MLKPRNKRSKLFLFVCLVGFIAVTIQESSAAKEEKTEEHNHADEDIVRLSNNILHKLSGKSVPASSQFASESQFINIKPKVDKSQKGLHRLGVWFKDFWKKKSEAATVEPIVKISAKSLKTIVVKSVKVKGPAARNFIKNAKKGKNTRKENALIKKSVGKITLGGLHRLRLWLKLWNRKNKNKTNKSVKKSLDKLSNKLSGKSSKKSLGKSSKKLTGKSLIQKLNKKWALQRPSARAFFSKVAPNKKSLPFKHKFKKLLLSRWKSLKLWFQSLRRKFKNKKFKKSRPVYSPSARGFFAKLMTRTTTRPPVKTIAPITKPNDNQSLSIVRIVRIFFRQFLSRLKGNVTSPTPAPATSTTVSRLPASATSTTVRGPRSRSFLMMMALGMDQN